MYQYDTNIYQCDHCDSTSIFSHQENKGSRKILFIKLLFFVVVCAGIGYLALYFWIPKRGLKFLLINILWISYARKDSFISEIRLFSGLPSFNDTPEIDLSKLFRKTNSKIRNDDARNQATGTDGNSNDEMKTTEANPSDSENASKLENSSSSEIPFVTLEVESVYGKHSSDTAVSENTGPKKAVDSNEVQRVDKSSAMPKEKTDKPGFINGKLQSEEEADVENNNEKATIVSNKGQTFGEASTDNPNQITSESESNENENKESTSIEGNEVKEGTGNDKPSELPEKENDSGNNIYSETSTHNVEQTTDNEGQTLPIERAHKEKSIERENVVSKEGSNIEYSNNEKSTSAANEGQANLPNSNEKQTVEEISLDSLKANKLNGIHLEEELTDVKKEKSVDGEKTESIEQTEKPNDEKKFTDGNNSLVTADSEKSEREKNLFDNDQTMSTQKSPRDEVIHKENPSNSNDGQAVNETSSMSNEDDGEKNFLVGGKLSKEASYSEIPEVAKGIVIDNFMSTENPNAKQTVYGTSSSEDLEANKLNVNSTEGSNNANFLENEASDGNKKIYSKEIVSGNKISSEPQNTQAEVGSSASLEVTTEHETITELKVEFSSPEKSTSESNESIDVEKLAESSSQGNTIEENSSEGSSAVSELADKVNVTGTPDATESEIENSLKKDETAEEEGEDYDLPDFDLVGDQELDDMLQRKSKGLSRKRNEFGKQ